MPAPNRIAAFDVGTNTVLMLVAEADTEGRVRALAEMGKITRLGRGIDKTGYLDSESATATLAAITEFAQAARGQGVEHFVAAATSALRDARDGAVFIARVREQAGIELEIISGEREAELNYQAAIQGLQLDPAHPLLIVDIGGGSTEFIASQANQPLRLASLRIGAVRLTERLIHNDPPSKAERHELEETIEKQIQALGWGGFVPANFVGVAGTVTTICSLALGLDRYDARQVHGYRLGLAMVEEVVERLFRLTTEERRRLPSMVAGRADVICAGAAILERTMRYFGQQTVIVSDQGVRWGLVYDEVARLG